MHRPYPIRRMLPLSLDHPGMVDLERRVCMAEHHLAHVAQTMLNVVRKARAVRRKADAEDVETVQLVHEREQERAVRGPEVCEPVRRGEERAPVRVCVQRKVRHAAVEDEPDRGELEGQLGGEVVTDVCCQCGARQAQVSSVVSKRDAEGKGLTVLMLRGEQTL